MTVTPPALPARPRTLEWIAATAILAAGVLLAMPGATFGNSPAYQPFAAIAAEHVWASFAMAVGLTRMAALWINGSWRRSPILRGVTSIMGVAFWMLIIALIMHARLSGPAMSLSAFGALLAIDFISAWRSGRDYIESERAYGRPI